MPLYWSRALYSLLMVLALVIITGCSGLETKRLKDPLSPALASPPEFLGVRQRAMLQHALELESSALQAAFSDLRRRGDWRKRGYFSAQEHDEMEGLLFRFAVNHSTFWGEFDRSGGARMLHVAEEEKPRAHVLLLHAGFALSDSSAFLVAEFQDDPIAISKINEAFYRSEIPGGTYDLLHGTTTSGARRAAQVEAWSLFTQARAQPDSELTRLAVDDADFKRLIDSIPGLHSRADGNLNAILPLDSDSLHALEQTLGHSEAASLGRSLQEDLAHLGYQTRALVFKDVSRIKSPRAHPIRFSEEQKRQIHATLRPGDILLSYTAGYVSSVFIPGQFKHGMTYVGNAAERAHVGLSSASLPEQAQAIASQFDKNLWTEVTADGRAADIIEAVAEGVKFSNLDQILDTHINRLLVLRPRLDDAERTAYLGGVFAYLGDPYDFTFDFADASRQVCTEVIYRAIQNLGGISFELTSRGGHPTLSADDLVLYHMNSQPSHFEFIFYAAEDPDHDDRRSRIWAGEEGERRLKALMLATE